MLDIKFIRENTAKCKERLALRGTNYDEAIDQALALDDKRKAIIGEVESLKAQQNKVSKQIPQMKKAGEDTTAIKELDAGRTEVEAQLRETLLGIPNVPADRVPAGADDTCNPEIRRWGEPKVFDYEPKAHWDIGADKGILLPEVAGKVTGSRFHFYRGMGARLELSLIHI